MRLLKLSILIVLCFSLAHCVPLAEQSVSKLSIDDPEMCLNRLDLIDEDSLEFFSKVVDFCAEDLEFKKENAENALLCDYATFKSAQNLSVDSSPADSSPDDSSPVDSLPADSLPADSSPVDSSPTDAQSDQRNFREKRSTPTARRTDQQPLFQIVQPVLMNVYDLTKTEPAIQILKCFYSQWPSLYQTTVSLGGTEYFYGPYGLSKAPNGETPFGELRSHTIWLRHENENFTVAAFEAFVEQVKKTDRWDPENYSLFSTRFNANAWVSDFSIIYYDRDVPDYILNSIEKFAASPLGQGIRRLVLFFQD